VPEQTPKRPVAGSKPSPATGGTQSPVSNPQAAAKKSAAAGPAAKAQQGEYQYLPVQCPNCGLEGKVKISRLDRTFTCKQCRKLFYCALDGTVSGERPPEADVDPAEFVTEEPQDWLSKRLESLPRVWQMAIFGVLVLAALYGLSVWMEPAKPLPGELEDRAAFAAKMLVTGQWKQVKRLAKRGTAGDLGRWYEQVRAGKWAEVTPETQVKIEVGQITQQLKGYEKQKPILDALVPVGIRLPGKSDDGPPDELFFRFSQDEESQWWLDGEALLANMRMDKGAAKHKKPAPKKDL
jgi:hypothetical protein